jgi:cytochrome c peroxidase
MAQGFASVLSAQSMFPVLSPDEMAGHYSENDVAQAVRLGRLTGPGGAWDIIAKRVEAIEDYRTRFDQVIGVGTPIHFTHISDSIAAFIAFEWRADQSAFDRYLRDGVPLSPAAQSGMELFYGKAVCSSCHSGQFQTDHGFHAIAMPQIGPGKAARFEDHQRDTGRLRVTGNTADAYKFRTPSLRNVALTAPYGHTGSHMTLDGVIRHHMDPVTSLQAYKVKGLPLPVLEGAQDTAILNDPDELSRIAAASYQPNLTLSDSDVQDLVAFLESLTDLKGARGRLGVPQTVPSGLPVDQ